MSSKKPVGSGGLPPAHSVKACEACGLDFEAGLPAEILACFEKSQEGSKVLHLTRTCPRCKYQWAEAPMKKGNS